MGKVLRWSLAGLVGLLAVPLVQTCLSVVGFSGAVHVAPQGLPLVHFLAYQAGLGLGNPWALFITAALVVFPVGKALSPNLTKKAPPAS